MSDESMFRKMMRTLTFPEKSNILRKSARYSRGMLDDGSYDQSWWKRPEGLETPYYTWGVFVPNENIPVEWGTLPGDAELHEIMRTVECACENSHMKSSVEECYVTVVPHENYMFDNPNGEFLMYYLRKTKEWNWWENKNKERNDDDVRYIRIQL